MEILERLAAGQETRQGLSRVAGVGLGKRGTPTEAEMTMNILERNKEPNMTPRRFLFLKKQRPNTKP